MKIPYIKIYTADLLAKTRRLTAEQIGEALIGVCEQAFDNETQYEPKNDAERAFYTTLLEWKNESVSALKQKKLAGKNGAKKRWQEKQLSDGSNAISTANSTKVWQTETETDTETEKNIYTAVKPQGLLEPKPKPKKELNNLQKFAVQVLEHFEPDVKTKDQKSVWYKRNCRCLSDILKFCEQNIPLAVKAIDVCLERMDKAGFSCGYEAVVRNIPEYYSVAKMKMEGTYAKKG